MTAHIRLFPTPDSQTPKSKTERTRGRRGRPSSFHEEMVEDVREMAEAGYTVMRIAEALDVSQDTLYRWAREFPAFSEALNARRNSDQRVEETLYAKALMGDTTAMIFWLKNRQPERWRDVKEHNLKGNVAVEDISDRKLAMALLTVLHGAVLAGEDDEPVTIEHKETE